MIPRRGGFTLIELLVAIVVTGLVLVMAHMLLSSVTTSAARQHQALAEDEADAMTVEWLGAAFRAAEIGRPDDSSFDGAAHSVSFTGYLPVPSGWPERRHIRLDISGSQFVMSIAGDESQILRAGVEGVAFDYLPDLGTDVRWVNEWHSLVSAPLAVRVRLHSQTHVDTMLFLVGARG